MKSSGDNLSHATGRMIKLAIGFKSNNKVRNITNPLKKYKFISHHIKWFKTHIYSYICYFTTRGILNDVHFLGSLYSVLNEVNIENILTTFQKQMLNYKDNKVD